MNVLIQAEPIRARSLSCYDLIVYVSLSKEVHYCISLVIMTSNLFFLHWLAVFNKSQSCERNLAQKFESANRPADKETFPFHLFRRTQHHDRSCVTCS